MKLWLLQAVRTWASRYLRAKLRRLGLGDSNVDGTELSEGSTAVNPYLFLARHGMAVAGTGAGASAITKKKLLPATTADSNGASTGNVTSAVADNEDNNKRSTALVE